MTKFDKDYLELVQRILNEGVEIENRTGINTIKVPEHYFKFDIGNEFPILQTKQTFYSKAIIEMLWIWQMQSNNVKELHNRNVHIWDEWMVDEDGIYRIYETNTDTYQPEKEVIVLDPLSVKVDDVNGKLEPKYIDGKILTAKSLIPGKNIKAAKYYGPEYANTIGTAYGYITNRYQHTQNLINTIKTNPTDRRLVKSLWQDEFLRTAVLPSCVWSTEWDVTNGKLNLLVHQRSCDVPLGLPFNITQYATLLKMIAQVTNLEPGTMGYSIKDAHIYINQLEGVKEQLRRWEEYKQLKGCNKFQLHQRLTFLDKQLKSNDISPSLKEKFETEQKIIDIILNPETPELWLNPEINDFFQFDNSKELKDIKVRKYKHMGKIYYPIAQ